MLVSIDWINDFTKLPEMSAHDLANRFTMATAEVEDVIESGAWKAQVRVAQIKSLRKHPEADKLNLVTIEYGAAADKEVVCGASNVREGLKIFYAPTGITLPAIGLTLEPKKIRGIVSEGMLCSSSELGLPGDPSGLLELPEDAEVGTNLLDFYNEKQDVLIDIDNKSLTHRPDLWGHLGMAREFASAFECELNNPYNDEWAANLKAKFTSDASPIAPKVDRDSCCKAYFGLSVDGVKVGPSPKWMQDRLDAVGLRPINNIVDISNYVMMEMGIPNHIFDRDLIKDNTIHIKQVGQETTFVTLDEFERNLIPTDTVITDSEKPLVLAGIMGGANSGVNDDTTKVFIEVANWHAASVRMTSTRLGLRTDSSQRYEKSLDSLLCERTMLRTLELLLELCPGAKVVGKMEYDGDDLSAIPTLNLKTSVTKICNTLGKEIAADKIVGIFTGLDFKVEQTGDNLAITVPSYRATKDVDCEADLIEEIGRIIGYDHITPISPKGDIEAVRLSPAKALHRKIQDFMMMRGRSLEVLTYPLVGSKLLDKASWDDAHEDLVIVNALSKDADRMRPSMIPSMLEKIAVNDKNFSDFSMFELGRSYRKGKKEYSEERSQTVIALYSKKRNRFLELANLVEDLLGFIGVKGELMTKNEKFTNDVIPYDWKGCHPNEYLNIRIMGRFMGAMTSVHPLVLRSFKIKGNLALAVIDTTDFEVKGIKSKVNYKPLPKFPGSTFDCTVVTSNKTAVEDVLLALKKVKIKELTDKKIVDIFQMENDEKAVTIRTTFMDPNATLSGDFLKSAEEQIIKVLGDAGYPLKS